MLKWFTNGFYDINKVFNSKPLLDDCMYLRFFYCTILNHILKYSSIMLK